MVQLLPEVAAGALNILTTCVLNSTGTLREAGQEDEGSCNRRVCKGAQHGHGGGSRDGRVYLQ